MGVISGMIFLACFIRAVAALMGVTIFFSNLSEVSPSLIIFLKAPTSCVAIHLSSIAVRPKHEGGQDLIGRNNGPVFTSSAPLFISNLQQERHIGRRWRRI